MGSKDFAVGHVMIVGSYDGLLPARLGYDRPSSAFMPQSVLEFRGSQDRDCGSFRDQSLIVASCCALYHGLSVLIERQVITYPL